MLKKMLVYFSLVVMLCACNSSTDKCKVRNCDEASYKNGFCVEHYVSSIEEKYIKIIDDNNKENEKVIASLEEKIGLNEMNDDTDFDNDDSETTVEKDNSDEGESLEYNPWEEDIWGDDSLQKDEIHWEISDDMTTLRIGGSGALNEYTTDYKWNNYDGYVKTVYIEEGITSVRGHDISYHVFRACIPESTETLYLPSTLVDIGQYAFTDCKITSLDIPKNVKTIGLSAVSWCEKLKKVVIPEGVERIGALAFYGNLIKEEVSIPKSVVEMHNDSFYLGTKSIVHYAGKKIDWIGMGMEDGDYMVYGE